MKDNESKEVSDSVESKNTDEEIEVSLSFDSWLVERKCKPQSSS
jgi:hypothetical protein